MKVRILLLIFIISVFAGKIFPCDMIAMMSRNGNFAKLMQNTPDTTALKHDIYLYDVLDYDTPYDYFVFLGRRSTMGGNRDGYGIVYYEAKQMLLPDKGTHLFYLPGRGKYYKTYPESVPHEWQHPLHAAYDNIRSNYINASIVVAHDRRGSSNSTLGNHPFRFVMYRDAYLKVPYKTCVFEHNGSCDLIKAEIVNFILD